MNEFFTWEVLLTFTGLTTVVYMITEFTKGISFIKKIVANFKSANEKITFRVVAVPYNVIYTKM